MRPKVMTARPVARKSGSSTGTKVKATVAVAPRKSEPMIQMVERRSSLNIIELPKKTGELPIPSSSFVF
ncbi:hypothetical protein BH11MYX2_BH11MYX2_01470 [soil metagenome]